MLNSDVKINLVELVTQNNDAITSRLMMNVNSLDITANKLSDRLKAEESSGKLKTQDLIEQYAKENNTDVLMMDDFPEPEKPNPAVLPQSSEERAIWRRAVRDAWTQGLKEADQLYADNVARMVRSYRGAMLYHLLTAQHLLSRISTASSDLGMHTTDNGNKLNIGQRVYRITAPSSFTVAPSPSVKKGRK